MMATSGSISLTRQAMILVGGRGTRLGALAASSPKPMMQIDDKSVFLDYLLFNIARFGFDDIILMAGYLSEQIVERYHGKSLAGAQIRVIVEPEPAGTAGALTYAKDVLQETFLFANGDTLFDVNMRPLDMALAAHPEATAVLAMRKVEDAGRYGLIEHDGAYIRGFREKEQATAGTPGLINAGIGLFRRLVLDRIQRLPCSIETDVYPVLAQEAQLLGAEFAGYFIDIGLPETLMQARQDLPARHRRPALFLDRDGVLNHDSGYTHRPEDLRWIDGARETIRKANDLGILTVVVSNQAGIGRGYFCEPDVARFHATMQQQLAAAGAHIDAFYICPYHADAVVPEWQHPDHPDRKPNPGMVLRALAEWPIDPRASILIGDRESDIEAGRRAGIGGVLFTGGSLFELASPLLDSMRR